MKLSKLQIVAAVALVIGLGLFIAGFGMLGFDITRLSTESPYEAKSYNASGPVRAITIDDRNADVEISPSSDDKIHVTYYENDKEYYDISESAQGELSVKSRSSRHWYDYVFVFQFQKPKLLVEVPANYDNDITAVSHDGSIVIKDIGVDDLLLTASDNEIQVKNVSASGRLEVKNSNSIYVNDVTVAGDIVCRTSTKKIDLDTVQGKSIEAVNNDGKITLKSVVSNESMNLKTSNGDIRLDTVGFNEELICTVSDGNCKGSITGALADYSITSKAADGKSNLPENMNSGDKIINIKTTEGDIQIDFVK